MKYPKVSDFFYFIMNRYALKRKQVAEIMGVTQSSIHNFLAGYTAPKKKPLSKLAKYLGEKPEVFEALAYESDKKGFSAAKADFPNVRAEILKNCYSKGLSFQIAQKDGVHDFELFLAGYTLMMVEDIKSLDTQGEFEVLKRSCCLRAMDELEKDERKRKKMFEIPGRWFASGGGLVMFENASLKTPPIKFFFDLDEALKEFKPYPAIENSDERHFLEYYRRMRDDQKKVVFDIMQEKCFYNSFKE